MLIILASWEAEIWRIVVLAQLKQKSLQDLISKKKVEHGGCRKHKIGGWAGQKARPYLQKGYGPSGRAPA
jgi:hypothetical protein